MTKALTIFTATILIAAAGSIVLASFIAWKAPIPGDDKGLATVRQYQGLYIFTDCQPVAKYHFLGTVKIPGISIGSNSYRSNLDKLIKHCHKEYDNADAIIFDGVEKADAIKFD